MSKKLLLGVILGSLAVAACGNPVSPESSNRRAPAPVHDGSAAPGGNMMGGGS